jgi:divalent metal cation (Fe/Co/Zn/Cd) transporter
MNRIYQHLLSFFAIFFASATAVYSQIPQQIDPSGPEAEETAIDSPWLYAAIAAIVLLIIIFYSAKKRAERKKREELNDKK